MIGTIAFDADDTLWHNETNYLRAGNQLVELLSAHTGAREVKQALEETEVRNLARYGYGIKSFTLSMIETALALSGRKISGWEIQKILEVGNAMLAAEVIPLDHTEETLAALVKHHDLMLITKGDLVEQGSKIQRSGLAGYFREIEIVQEKSAITYRKILDHYAIPPEQFLMVGNSLKSDILPVLEISGTAVFIPYQHTWTHEKVARRKRSSPAYIELEHLGQLPGLVAQLDRE